MCTTFRCTCILTIASGLDITGGEFPVAEDAYERLISLPMFHAMSDQDVQDVIAAVSKVVSSYSR